VQVRRAEHPFVTMTDSVDDPVEVTFFWVKLVMAILALVATTSGRRRIMVRVAALSLWFAQIQPFVLDDGEFVRRQTLETEFETALKTVDSQTVFLYGQRGSGKTSFSLHALSGKY
jgi:hypothetical protein